MAVRRAGQILRIGVGSAALASIPAITYNFKVFAADQAAAESRIVNITKLPLYENPEDRFEYRFVPEEISPLRQVIQNAREAIWNYFDTIQETTDKVKEKFEVGKAHTEEQLTDLKPVVYVRDPKSKPTLPQTPSERSVIDYLQNDPGMLPRVAVISVAGLGGIVAGYRGGIMRKVLFSTAAITAATSLCYPNEAVAFTTDAYNITLESVKGLWEVGPPPSVETPTVVQESSPTTADNQTTTVRPNTIRGDPGQSKEEDKDLYTTRSN